MKSYQILLAAIGLIIYSCNQPDNTNELKTQEVIAIAKYNNVSLNWGTKSKQKTLVEKISIDDGNKSKIKADLELTIYVSELNNHNSALDSVSLKLLKSQKGCSLTANISNDQLYRNGPDSITGCSDLDINIKISTNTSLDELNKKYFFNSKGEIADTDKISTSNTTQK